MLVVAYPMTIAITQIRSSLAMDRVEGDISTECLMFSKEKVMACLTPTSERSIVLYNKSVSEEDTCSEHYSMAVLARF